MKTRLIACALHMVTHKPVQCAQADTAQADQDDTFSFNGVLYFKVVPSKLKVGTAEKFILNNILHSYIMPGLREHG